MSFDYGLERGVQQSEYSAFDRVETKTRIDFLKLALDADAQVTLAHIYQEYTDEQIQSQIQKDYPHYSNERIHRELNYIKDIWNRLQGIK